VDLELIAALLDPTVTTGEAERLTRLAVPTPTSQTH
jgi:hypothetical protein